MFKKIVSCHCQLSTFSVKLCFNVLFNMVTQARTNARHLDSWAPVGAIKKCIRLFDFKRLLEESLLLTKVYLAVRQNVCFKIKPLLAKSVSPHRLTSL